MYSIMSAMKATGQYPFPVRFEMELGQEVGPLPEFLDAKALWGRTLADLETECWAFCHFRSGRVHWVVKDTFRDQMSLYQFLISI